MPSATSIAEPWRVRARAELLGDAAGDVGEAYPLAADVNRVGVELGEVQEVDGQLRQPVDLLAHRAHELGSGSGIGVVVLEQLDKSREREDRRSQLVRGVGDELLAGAVEYREALLHLVEGHRQLADLVRGVDRDRRREVAVGDLLGGLLEAAQPARVRAGDEIAGTERGEQGDAAGDEDLAADQRDVVVDVARGPVEKTATQRALPLSIRGTAVWPRRSPPTPSTALAVRSAAGGRVAAAG